MCRQVTVFKIFCCFAAVYVHLVLSGVYGFVRPIGKTIYGSAAFEAAQLSPAAAAPAAAAAAAPAAAAATATPAAAAAATAGPLSTAGLSRQQHPLAAAAARRAALAAAAAAGAAAAATAAGTKEDPYDIAVVGLGVGGHAACLHAKSLGLRVAAVSGGDPGGTCVNRGCIPSKALLAAARRVRMLQQQQQLQAMGIHLNPGAVQIHPTHAGKYALDIAARVRKGLLGSLASHKIPVIDAVATVEGPGVLSLHPTPTTPEDTPETLYAKNIILAPGSVPFVPPGIDIPPQQQQEPQQIMTSDTAVGLPLMPSFIAIVGAGYIGLEFADVFSSMGSEVVLVEAGDRILCGVDPEIAEAAKRLLLQRDSERPIKLLNNTLVSSIKRMQPQNNNKNNNNNKPKPLEIYLKDTITGSDKGMLMPDACLIATGRKPVTQGLGLERLGVVLQKGGFIPVDKCMRVLRGTPSSRKPRDSFESVSAAAAAASSSSSSSDGESVVEGLYCVGDANGVLQLAHAASAQAIAAVETIAGRQRMFNPHIIPAACFTNPEIAFVGHTEPEAVEMSKNEGFALGVGRSNFRANSKAIAEGEAEGIVKILWRKDTGQLLGCHIIGPHAGDLIQQCSNAMASKTPVQQLAYMTHTHPTLSEAVEAAWKNAIGLLSH